MKLALIAFEGMTLLDLVGFYDPVTRLRSMGLAADMSWDICGWESGVRDDRGTVLQVDKVSETLAGYDLIYAPGGMATRKLIFNEGFVDWLRTGSTATWKTSACTGALLLGAAGFLTGKAATTHPTAYDELRPYCGRVVEDRRVVSAGNVVTARGVSASIDLGLFMCEQIAGTAAAGRIRRQMDWPYS